MSGPTATGAGKARRVGRWTLRQVAVPLAWIAGLLVVTPWLLVFGRTWPGRLVGAVGLGYMVFIALQLTGWPDPVYAYAAALMIGGQVGTLLARPRPQPSDYYGPWAYSPWARPVPEPVRWWHRVPFALETDLIRVGIGIMTRVDPWMSWAEARTIRRVMRQLLAEMDADPAYLLPWAGYEELFRAAQAGEPWRQHVYAYVPRPRDDDERLGLAVFLHGHGPNSALYLHAWRRFCDEYRVGVVCPSFGYGNWEHPDGVQAVAWALETARASEHFDESRVYLAGISQGGAGVGRAGAAMPGAFAGLILLSPTTEPGVLGSAEFVQGWAGRPVLVVQGGRDHNVKPATVDAAVEQMRANGAEVTYHRDAAADHFLFFAQLEAMHRLVGDWMAG